MFCVRSGSEISVIFCIGEGAAIGYGRTWRRGLRIRHRYLYPVERIETGRLWRTAEGDQRRRDDRWIAAPVIGVAIPRRLFNDDLKSNRLARINDGRVMADSEYGRSRLFLLQIFVR
jgi:hypothetical protein